MATTSWGPMTKNIVGSNLCPQQHLEISMIADYNILLEVSIIMTNLKINKCNSAMHFP